MKSLHKQALFTAGISTLTIGSYFISYNEENCLQYSSEDPSICQQPTTSEFNLGNILAISSMMYLASRVGGKFISSITSGDGINTKALTSYTNLALMAVVMTSLAAMNVGVVSELFSKHVGIEEIAYAGTMVASTIYGLYSGYSAVKNLEAQRSKEKSLDAIQIV